MAMLQKLFILAGPLLLLLLTAIAGYAYSQIRFLSLPIPQALGLLTVLLPLVSGLSTQGLCGLIKRSKARGDGYLTIPPIAVFGLQLIYETIVATLAMTYIVPPSNLFCGLNDKWQQLFQQQNGNAVRAIQDSFDCCGFKTIKDRAFPFAEQRPSDCPKIYGRSKSCVGEWTDAEQKTAGLLLFVALAVFVIKLVSIVSLFLGRPSWARSSRAHLLGPDATDDVERPEEDSRAVMRRLIEEGAGDGNKTLQQPTSSNTEAPPRSDGQEQGPRVQPSSLLDSQNEWRDRSPNDESH